MTEDKADLHWLFLDLDAYFASVEEQETPSLRGHPLAIIPVQAETTCCIAANYPAKAFGIQTGMNVQEAKMRCPSLRVVLARQDLYVAYHHRIVEAVNSCLPIDRLLSIDEMICRLTGSQGHLNAALELAQQIKRVLSNRVGPYVRASIGLAPNRYLAKVAADMQKPDGLMVILKRELPQVLFQLPLRKLPGIGEQMEKRLNDVGISTIKHLCQLSQKEMHALWRSREGDNFYFWLRGQDTPETAHQRYSIGHSHVLSPDFRSREKSYEIAKALLAKAARRLREEAYWARGLTLMIQYQNDLVWEGKAKFAETHHTPVLLKILAAQWEDVPHGRKPLSVSVTFQPLLSKTTYTPSLFDDLNQDRLDNVVDATNVHFGKDVLYEATLLPGSKKVPARISFNRIPKLSEF